MTLEEHIKRYDDRAKSIRNAIVEKEESQEVVEWLRELKEYREFADWLIEAVLEEDWEDNSDFYAEVFCRKLIKLGKLKVVDNKYMEVKADDT